MSDYIKQCTTVARKLIRTAKANGFTVKAVHDGEEWVKVCTEAEALEAALGVDESHIRFRNADGDKLTYFLVMGNEPDELVCDYSCVPELQETADTIARGATT